MEHTTIAVDLAKSVFQVAVSSHHGSVDAERRLSRPGTPGRTILRATRGTCQTSVPECADALDEFFCLAT
jgi:hypothetical protein